MPFNSLSTLGLADPVFDRVVIDHLHAGGSRVSWRMREDFADPSPWQFELQVGESAVQSANDWSTVASVTDGGVLVDDTPRDVSVNPTTHYRVKLVSESGTYYSKPEPSWGTINRRDWLLACAIARREMLRLRVNAAEPGWLFKRRKKTAVVPDTKVVDFLTREIRSTRNTAGVGTDRIGGFFNPVLHYIDLDPAVRYSHRDADRGNVDDVVTLGQCLAFPQLEHGDVWATATGDARFQIHEVTTVCAFRNIPLIVNPKVYRLSPSDPVFELPLPDVPPLQTAGRDEI